MLLNEQYFTYPNTIAPGNQTFVYLCALPERAWFFDGFQLRNVIFDGVGIEYKGGPIRLENVYFVNCTFDVQQTSKDSTTKSLSTMGTHICALPELAGFVLMAFN